MYKSVSHTHTHTIDCVFVHIQDCALWTQSVLLTKNMRQSLHHKSRFEQQHTHTHPAQEPNKLRPLSSTGWGRSGCRHSTGDCGDDRGAAWRDCWWRRWWRWRRRFFCAPPSGLFLWGGAGDGGGGDGGGGDSGGGYGWGGGGRDVQLHGGTDGDSGGEDVNSSSAFQPFNLGQQRRGFLQCVLWDREQMESLIAGQRQEERSIILTAKYTIIVI